MEQKKKRNEKSGGGKSAAVRILLLFLFGALWTWFFLPVPLYGVLNLGNGAGMLGFGALFLLTMFSGRVMAGIRKRREKRSGKIFLGLCSAFLLLAFGAAVFLGGLIVKGALNAPPEDISATVVVLGCKVQASGQPSRILNTRLKAAADYLSSHPGAVCIVSGGKGADEPLSEAEAMYQRLTEMGIPKERILMEAQSTSTRENLKFSAAIIEELGLPETMIIATNEFHQCRAQRIAEKLGYESYAVSAPSPLLLLPTYFVREMFGIVYESVSAN